MKVQFKDFREFMKDLLHQLNDPEEIAKREARLAEKKRSFIFSIQHGDHFGSSCYRMIFKEDTSRKDFFDIMEKAEASDNCYKDLSNESFRDENGILDIEHIEPEFQGYIEEYRLFNLGGVETDEPELVEELEDE